ncbi:MAG TPA: phospholipid carrier-dependent glycosyltransferase [Planctomycetaceae bacterium]
MSTTGTSSERDDRELERLAAEPARPLFPLLNQADAMIPFVVVLAFLPALYAVTNRTLTEAGAELALAGIRCQAIADPLELFDPSSHVTSSGPLNEVSLQTGPSLQIGPSLQTGQPFRYQPPLMVWLTGLAMKGFGIGNVAGLVGAAYLCTAGLLVASYVLARRMGGEPLGLVTVVLLAFNPLILQGAQEPVPQSPANLFALLALAGVLVHWQKSSAFVSYPLLLAGIALGICLLAGGPAALAVLLIVLVYVPIWKLAAWKFEAWQHDRSGVVWDRSQTCRRTALRSTLVLAATAFAFGGWTVLLPASRHGGDFWTEWLTGGATAAVASEPGPARTWVSAAFWEMNRLAVPVFALALLGLATIVRDLWRAQEDPAKRHRGILLAWVAIALFAWLLLGGPASHGAPHIKVWETLLTIPLIIAAALGAIEIAERRIGFLWSLSVGFLALADAAVWGRQGLDGDRPESALDAFSSAESWGWGRGVVAPLVVVAIGTALAAFAGASEKRRRSVLSGVLVTTILINCVWGAWAVRRTNIGDRELDEVRASLSRLKPVDRLTFVALASPETVASLQPPPQLIYVLASIWPQSSMNFAGSWESALRPSAADAAGKDAPPAEPGVSIFIAWSPRGRVRGTAPDTSLKTAAAPFLFQGKEFVAYIRNRSTVPRLEENSESGGALE